MLFKAEIDVMPLKEILDPQGKAVLLGLHNLGIATVAEVRIGRHITLALEAESADEARALVDQACRQLLHNPIMEAYSFTVSTEPGN